MLILAVPLTTTNPHALCFAVPFAKTGAVWSTASWTEGEGRGEEGARKG